MAIDKILSTSLGSGVGGKIGQVVSVAKTDTFTTTSTSYTDITGLSISITPSASSSKILIIPSIYLGPDEDAGADVRLMRDTTPIAVGDSAGNRDSTTFGADFSFSGTDVVGLNLSLSFLDSPSTTNSVTYKLQGIAYGLGGLFINRSSHDANTSRLCKRSISTITLKEILA